MNMSKGLFRLWMLLAAIWVLYTFWLFWSGCTSALDADGKVITETLCRTGARNGRFVALDEPTKFSVVDWLRWIRFAALPPGIVLAIGASSFWVLRGFKISN